MPHGFDDDLWEQAKAEAKQILGDRARVRGTMTYSELARRIQSINFEAGDSRFNRWLLRDVSVEEDRDGRGMLTVIVVRQDGDMDPGPGFFDLARELERVVFEPTAFWLAELNAVHDAWAD